VGQALNHTLTLLKTMTFIWPLMTKHCHLACNIWHSIIPIATNEASSMSSTMSLPQEGEPPLNFLVAVLPLHKHNPHYLVNESGTSHGVQPSKGFSSLTQQILYNMLTSLCLLVSPSTTCHGSSAIVSPLLEPFLLCFYLLIAYSHHSSVTLSV
jgi:hypothetical protein